MRKILFILFFVLIVFIFVKNVNAKPSFVTVQNGHFYKDGKRINFIGGVVMANTSSGPAEIITREGIELMARSGLNLVTLWTDFANLMPIYGEMDDDYLNVLDNLVGNFTSNKIYVQFRLRPPGAYGPTWMTDKWGGWYNETVTKAYEWILGNLSVRYKNEEYVLGYEVPYPEPYFTPNQFDYMSGSDWATGNMTVMWNMWLKNKYGSIKNLNSTWNASSKSMLNGTAGEDHFLTDWGDDQAGGIKFPYNFRNGVDTKDDFRMPDWKMFVGQWYVNYTNRVIQVVRNNDPNHLILWPTRGVTYPDYGWDWRQAYTFPNDYPDIDALVIAGYIEPHSEPYDDAFWYDLYNCYAWKCVDNLVETLRIPTNLTGFPIISLENGAGATEDGLWVDPYPLLDNTLAQLYFLGLDGVTFYLWAKKDDGVSGHGMLETPTGPLWDRQKAITQWAEAFKSNKREMENNTILVIGSDWFKKHNYDLFFTSLGIRTVRTATVVGEYNPELLNDFDVILLVINDGMSNETLIRVREWAEAGKGKVIVITSSGQGGATWDEHNKPYTESEVGWDTWFMTDMTSGAPSVTTPYNITFAEPFGDINAGEVITIDDAPNKFPWKTASDFISGTRIIANLSGTNNVTIAKNPDGNAYFIAWAGWSLGQPNYPVDSGWRRIWYNVLKEVGLNPQYTSYHLVINDVANGYAAILDHSATSGTVNHTVNITESVNASKFYVIYEVNPHNNITILPSPVYLGTVSGSTLRNGWNIEMNAYHSKLLRVIDSSIPSYILVLNGSLVSENLTDKRLNIKVFSAPEANVSTSIYIPEGFYPNDNFSVKTNSSQYSYSWNPEERLLKVWTIT